MLTYLAGAEANSMPKDMGVDPKKLGLVTGVIFSSIASITSTCGALANYRRVSCPLFFARNQQQNDRAQPLLENVDQNFVNNF